MPCRKKRIRLVEHDPSLASSVKVNLEAFEDPEVLLVDCNGQDALHKLQVHNKVDAVRLAMERKIV